LDMKTSFNQPFLPSAFGLSLSICVRLPHYILKSFASLAGPCFVVKPTHIFPKLKDLKAFQTHSKVIRNNGQ